MGLVVIQSDGAEARVPTYMRIVSITLTEQETYRNVGCVDT